MPRPTQRLAIFGTIGSAVTSEGVAQQLAAFDRSAAVLVEINSDGGAVHEGVAIYNLLRAWPAGVDVEIVGWALSAATVVAMAGRVIRMHPTSLMMVHAPWLSVTGNAGELRSTADVLEQVASSMRGAYARTGKGSAIDGWLDGTDHWFTADQAVKAGLADEVITGDVFEFANASGTRHPVPAHILERLTTMTTLQAGATAETIRAEAVRAEVTRRGAVRAAFAHFSRHEGMADVQRQCEDDPTCDVDLANTRILAQLGRGVTPCGGVVTGDPYGGSGSDFHEGMRDALLIRAGLRVDQPHPIARDMRHMSIVTMAETLLSRTGRTPASRSPADIIKMSLTTSDFPALLADVANKALRIGYNEAPLTYTQWTAEKDVPDFKPNTLAMLSEGPDLKFKGESAEYTYGAILDGSTTFKIETFGRIIRLSREALINDSLEAFSDIPRAHGQAARRLEADKVYALLTSNPTLNDGVALFHATHGNLAGAGAAVSLATLGAARAAMRVQKGIAGLSFIDPQPRFLIVPVAMETACEALLATLSSGAKGNDMAPSWVRGLTLVADPRLDVASTAAWYLAASPGQVETVVRAYLATAERPYLDEFEDKNTDAMNFKSRLDFGVGVIDYRGLYKNPGA